MGLASGFFEGWPAAVLFRVTEWFLVIPFLPLALVLATVLGRGLFNISLVIGLTSWPATALLIRSPDPVDQGAALPRAGPRPRRRPAGTRSPGTSCPT